MTASTLMAGFALRILSTALPLAEALNPNMVSALMASARTPFSSGSKSPKGNSVGSPPRSSLRALSLRSTMIRWAVLVPSPFTFAIALALPVAMSIRSSSAVKAERIIRAVAAPMPLTVISNSKICRSVLVTNPYISCVSSRMISEMKSFASRFSLPTKAEYVGSVMAIPYPIPAASITASVGFNSVNIPLIYSIILHKKPAKIQQFFHIHKRVRIFP